MTDIESLEQIIREQLARRGRLHLRALVAEMRKRARPAATEPLQELSLVLGGKFRLFPAKARRGAEKAASGGQVFAYYPGCLLMESAREYDASIRRTAGELGVRLAEIDGWTCCGAGVVQKLDPPPGPGLAARNLEHAGGSTIVSGCPICVERLREAGGPDSALHLLDLFSRDDLREKLAARIQATGEERPVGSLKVVCYAGCGFPRGESRTHDPLRPRPRGEGRGEGSRRENPTHPIPRPRGEGMQSADSGRPAMETLMELVGAEVCRWSGARRRLGPFDVFTESEHAFRTLEKVFRDFETSGADAIVTACPHCHFNLDSFQYTLGRRRRRALEVPVLHFTELLALAMNLDETDRWLARHVTSPFPLVDRLCTQEEKRKAALRRATRTSVAKERKRREKT
jgi:heterodisulfide reductase subunit B